MSAEDPPKYSRREIERRWLVADDRLPELDAYRFATIIDRYLDGTRLRLRRVVADGQTTFKLCKKYGDGVGAESITNLYLSPAEYARLDQLPGTVVEKRRYVLEQGSLDRYTRDAVALTVFEREFFDSADAERFTAPSFTTREITFDPAFDGAALARRFDRAGQRLSLQHLPGSWSVHRLPPDTALPQGLLAEAFFALLRSPAELSVCCREEFAIIGSQRQDGWACLAVDGPLDFTLTGIVAGISAPLARAGVPVFVMSSYDTDYLLVPRQHLHQAVTALEGEGMTVAAAVPSDA